MINFNRVFAMVIRDFLNLRHVLDRLTDMFYWPAVDLLLWGLVGLYFAQKNSNFPHAVPIILTGLIFWIVIWRGQFEININLLSEVWDKNLVNIFASPLKPVEWMLSFLIFGGIKMLISLAFSALLAFLLYHFNIFIYGFSIIPFVLSLLITGWAVGFIVAGFLIYFGQKIQTITWSAVFLIIPFSAPYYSVATLPPWAQAISKAIPSSCVFEGLRQILFTGSYSSDKLFISFGLNFIYLILSVWFFMFMFEKSRKLGFGRLI